MASSAIRVPEAAWLASVLEIAAMCGYALRFHDNATNAPRRCPKCGEFIRLPRNRAGFLDCTLGRPRSKYRPARLVFAELKVGRNGLTPEQEAWVRMLRDAGQECYVWYPHQAQEVADILRADGPSG